eukprot:COSAG02_NODE_468_length_21758_cov_41.206796_23_plen_95_part_00
MGSSSIIVASRQGPASKHARAAGKQGAALARGIIARTPIASRIILSIDRGPSVVRIVSATAFAAAMFPSCAFFPCSRLVLVFNTITPGPPAILP